jgi:quinol monooxygenase YgiN
MAETISLLSFPPLVRIDPGATFLFVRHTSAAARKKEIPMVRVGLVVRLVASAGKEEELAAFLAGAEPLAKAEAFTPAWLALRTEHRVFYIVDVFADDAARQKHIGGAIADALRQKAPELLAEPPKIERADVLGVKLPS